VTVSWAIDPGGDIRPIALDVADAIAKRVAAEVNRHREYAVIPATLEVAQREMRARWWTHPQLMFDSLYYGGVPSGFTNRPR